MAEETTEAAEVTEATQEPASEKEFSADIKALGDKIVELTLF